MYSDIEIFKAKYVTITTGLINSFDANLVALPFGNYRVKIIRYAVDGNNISSNQNGIFTARLIDPLDIKTSSKVGIISGYDAMFVAFSWQNVISLNSRDDFYIEDNKKDKKCSVYDFWAAKDDKEIFGKLDKAEKYILFNINNE